MNDNKKPKMLEGTLSRQEREDYEKAMQQKAHRRRQRRIWWGLAGVVVLAGIVVGMHYTKANHTAKPIEQSVAKDAKLKVGTEKKQANVKAKKPEATKQEQLFTNVAQEIKPAEYIKNIYGKTKALYLIVGSNNDMRTKMLSQLMVAQKANLHNTAPIYYIDANKYLASSEANNDEKIAMLQLLNGLGLVKIDGQSIPANVKFTSTLYANKLTQVDNKPAYTSYTAPEGSFTDLKALYEFFAAANTQLAK